jgi:hypothetical protein
MSQGHLSLPLRALFLSAVLAAFGTLLARPAHAAPSQWADNGHWYEAIAGNTTWDAANVAAMASTFMGMPGHLATATSAGENVFISALAPTPTTYVIGGYQDPTATTVDGGWKWVTGEPWAFTNWYNGSVPPYTAIEPNDGNDYVEALGRGDEDQLHLFLNPNSAGLMWNDFSYTSVVSGYVVEYESLAVIPEPEIYALLMAGLGLLGFRSSRARCARSARRAAGGARRTRDGGPGR